MYAPCINVITNNNKQWAWGSAYPIGMAASTSGYNPVYMPGNSVAASGMKLTDEIIALETGGHTTINIKKGSDKFGYIGHNLEGSMGDGSNSNAAVLSYTYNTAAIALCAADITPYVQNMQICQGTTSGNLNNANLEAIPAQIEWHATNDVNSPVMTNITAVGTGTYYAFFTIASGRSRALSSAVTVFGVVCCASTDCNSNSYVNSSDPNTIEYDQMVSAYHATVVKEKDGTFKIWGNRGQPNGSSDQLSPIAVTPANGFAYTGTPLRATTASSWFAYDHQYVLLTTDGLYAWGGTNSLISSSIKSTTAFGKITVNGKADGLPAGVLPGQVKMMFGSYGTLAIVTCTGEAWVLSFNGSKNGDGTAQDATNNVIWHRVRTSAAGNPTLDNVVAIRGIPSTLFALTSDGKLYTWGADTYINSGVSAARTYATEVSVPAGATPKMIGMSQGSTSGLPSYYLLATNGKLYTMGNNTYRELGDGTTTSRTTWVQPQKITNQNGQGTGVLENIVWISPNEHTVSSPYINVLTNNNKLWTWGTAYDANMFFGSDPIYMQGNSTNVNGMSLTDEVIAVESGGHTTINIKKGTDKFGYIGHQDTGSMGNGSSVSDAIFPYTYNNTASISVCMADIGPYVQNLTICQGTTAGNLNNANLEATPAQVEWHATNDPNSPVMTNITAVGTGTYYAFFTVASGKPRTVGSAVTVTGVVCCTSGDCNPNAYVNSSDPNTIEYDNMVSLFHSTVIKESNGTFKVWGEATAPNGTGNLLSPTAITPANSFNYTGTPLKATGGSGNVSGFNVHQYALLTTDGLYVWGAANTLISSSIKNTTAFGKITVNSKADGLPAGVLPGQVKMMFGSYGTLAIVTCSGDAWVLSFDGAKNGDGTAQDATNNVIWHRVRTSAAGNPTLDNVVAMRGAPGAMFALTSTGKLYTWGTGTYINSGAVANRVYATEVTAPAGVTPKMIGMTMGLTSGSQSYYLLASDGRLFSMGENSSKQLGDGTSTNRTTWVQPQKITNQSGQGTGALVNIAWISPGEHSSYAVSIGAINALTNDRKQWAWGNNNYVMLGGSGTYIDPTYMPGSSTATDGMKVTDEIIAVETGGHTSMNIKKGSDKFGYVGHYINGSMGNGINTDSNVSTYSYQTAAVMVCATSTGPSVQDIKICEDTTGDLNNANLEATPGEVEWHATNDVNSPVMTNITAVAPGTYYAFYTVASGKSRTVSSAAIVSYYLLTDPANPCVVCYGPDTDGDGIPDMCDLDADNDGILNTDECSANVDRVVEWNHNDTSNPWSATGINGSYIASASNSTPGAGLTRSQYVTVSWLDGITSTSYADAVSKNTYVEYSFTTAAFGTASHYFYDRSVFWWTPHGTHTGNKYKVAVAISNDNFATSKTVLADIDALQNGTYPTYNNTNKYRLNPSTSYKVRVYMYGLTNPGQTIDYDDYSFALTSYCDTDGDNTPDYLDLDSDGDTCPDALEGDENVLASQLNPDSSINIAANGGIDTNGVPNLVNSGGTADVGGNQGQGVGSSKNAYQNACQDTDGDGVPDYIDLDDDNDGILDLDEDCGYLAQNASGTWIGQTASTVTVTTNGVLATQTSSLNDFQNRYFVNQSGAGQWVDRIGEINQQINFSPAVPASEIALHVFDLTPVISTSFVNFTIKVNGSTPNNSFVSTLLDSAPTYLNYDTVTGIITASASTDRQSIMLKGVGNMLVSSIQITSSGIASTDRLYYSFYGKKICDADGDGIPNHLDLDSDNDGCLDAIEGSENVTTSMLVAAAPGLSVGTGSSASNQNLCAGSGCVDAQGVPTVVNAGGAADTGNNQGQGVGSSEDLSVNACLSTLCYKPGATTGGVILDTKAGITSLSRAGADNSDNWPMTRKGGWIALESKTKGFVPNRVAFSGGNPVGIATADFVEGMMVYDTTNKCLKVYTLKDGDVAMAWHCITTQACPD